MIKKVASFLAITSLVSTSIFGIIQPAYAASVTTFSDTLSTLVASTAANHTIYFVTPTGVASGGTVTLTFDADFTGVSSIDDTDLDFAEGDSGTCTTASYTEETLVAAGATSSQFNASASGQVITFESGGASATVTAARCIRIKIGTNATSGVTGGEQISNGVAANAHSVTIGGSFGDSGTAAIDIIADDSVNITATVDPTITFTISDTTVGFGTLTTGSASWATGDTNGVTSAPADSSGAHEMTLATNAASGYSITYNGATLTSGGNTIDVATISEDDDGTPASEQFALGLDDNGGNVTIVSDYDLATTNSYKFVASTTTTVASETAPTAIETFDVQYIANISTVTEAGSYSTDITWIATGNF
mgnify:CR=1 FL=1